MRTRSRVRCRTVPLWPTFYFWMLMLLVLLARIHGFQNANSRQSWTESPNLSRNRISRRMVLTTPESIIEQASTRKLLDDLIDESVRTSARKPIMMQFDPSSGWIWKRWKGTVFSETWDSCVKKMAYACVVLFLCNRLPGRCCFHEFSNLRVLS